MDRPRPWHDKHMISHLAFLPSLGIALLARRPVFFELVCFVAPVLVLSVIYHRRREPQRALLSRCEHVAAKVLYIYGCMQTVTASSPWTLALYLACFCATSLTFIYTNLYPALWDTWHSVGMHVVPGLWCAVVAWCNEPLGRAAPFVLRVEDAGNASWS